MSLDSVLRTLNRHRSVRASLPRHLCERALIAVLLLAPPLALAQPIPLPPVSRLGPGGAPIEVTREQGLEFVTVRDAGVTPIPAAWISPTIQPAAVPANLGVPVGGGGAGFRMSRSELTYGEYFTFLQAWLPYSTPDLRTNLTGIGIRFVGGDSADPANYQIRSGREMFSATITWRLAAIYCNWLHNDRGTGSVTGAAAFSSGAYDISTFVFLPDSNGNLSLWGDQVTRSPGARYWIPSLSEQLMAMHWDPNRNGPGQGGWWPYTLPQDTQPVSGPPGTPGAQSSSNVFGVPALSYLDVQNAWGLFDTSGGAAEWTESLRAIVPAGEGARLIHGSSYFTSPDIDLISEVSFRYPLDDTGLRIAAAIPAPHMLPIFCFATLITASRRRSSRGNDATPVP